MFRRLAALANLPVEIWQMVVCYLPGPVGFALRYRFWRKRLGHLGKQVVIGTGVYFQGPEFISISDNCWVDNNVAILAGPDRKEREKIEIRNRMYRGKPGFVHVGRNVHIGPGSIISGISAGVYISDDCGFSAGCRIFAFSHHYRSRRKPSDQNIHFGPMVDPDRQCIVEGPVWIGANTGVALGATLLPGVAIPENCFVAINSVVGSGKFRENSIIKGDPAKIIGDRFEANE